MHCHEQGTPDRTFGKGTTIPQVLIAILLGGWSAGCRTPAAVGTPAELSPSTAAAWVAAIPIIPRDLVPEISDSFRVPSPAVMTDLPAVGITEEEVARAAGAHSTTAQLLEAEATAVSTTAEPRRTCSATTLAEMLRWEAHQQREDAADAALQVLWQLAAAEMGAVTLDRCQQAATELVAAAATRRTHDVPSPVSVAEARLVLLDLQHQQVALEESIRGLQEELSRLIGIAPPPGHRWWPDVTLDVVAEIPDLEAATTTALQNRGDLNALRLAVEAADQDITAVLLGAANPLLGLRMLGPCSCRLLLLRPSCCEQAARDQQLQMLLAEREEQVRREMAQSHYEVQQRLRQVDLQRQRVVELELLHNQAQREAAVHPDARLKELQARIALLRGRQELLQDSIAWRRKRLEAGGGREAGG